MALLRLPAFFRPESTPESRREREERLEKLLTQKIRDLSNLLQDVANRLEARRLEKSGHGRPGEFLERVKRS